nr:hypothetical protein [Tanacetum cinerariifolium]
NGDSVSPVASASAGAEGPIPPKTAEQKLAKKNELKAKSTLMLAILDEHLLKFHACKDANKKGLDKTCDWFQNLISQFEIHDTLSMDDLYNNLKVYESEIKSQSSSSSNSKNVAFVSLDNSSNTNETVNIAYSVSAASFKDQASSASYADDVEEELTNFALMAYTSKGLSSSYSEVHTCSKECLKSYEALQKQYDQQCEALNKSNIEITCYQMGLESLEARIVVHEKNKAVYEEDITFLKYDVQVKDISIKEIKNQLENALKENDDLKLKLEKFETSSKNLTKRINSQISAIDKTGIGYDGQMNESDLNDIHANESEVLNNVVDSCKNDGDDNQVNDRFEKGEGYHAVPLPYTGNYMPQELTYPLLDYNSVFKSKVSETITSVPKIETNASKTSKDSLEKPKTVWSSAPLIEECESDSEDENVFKPKEVKKIVKPSLEKD